MSSASAVASAGSLAANGNLSAEVAAHGAVLASLMSLLVNLPLVARLSGQRPLTVRRTRASVVIALLGAGGIVVQSALTPHLPR